MENILKINLKEVFHKMIILSVAGVCFALFIQFTQQSVNNSINNNFENINNHPVFAVNY